MDEPFVLQFRSLGSDYTMTIYPDTRLTVCQRGESDPIIDVVSLPSAIGSFFLGFTADQREVVADLCMRSYRRGYDAGRRDHLDMLGDSKNRMPRRKRDRIGPASPTGSATDPDKVVDPEGHPLPPTILLTTVHTPCL